MFDRSTRRILSRGTAVLWALLFAFTPLVVLADEDNTSPEATAPVFLKGGVDTFSVLTDEIQGKIGIACTNRGGTEIISKVFPGTKAFQCGLKEGDAILDARTEHADICLMLKRNGKPFFARIDKSGKYNVMQPITDSAKQKLVASVQTQDFSLKARRTQVLSQFKLEFIIDRSLSMQRRDCPGGLSRWDWCAYQTADIAQTLNRVNPEGLAITRFAWDYDVDEHATPQSIISTLGSHDFQRGTRLCEALHARLENYFSKRRAGDKPLLIAVITDGCPAPRPEPLMVREELIDASQRIRRPGEVTIVFLQIGGDDVGGQRFLYQLGQDQLQYGYSKPYVFTKSFDELAYTGLSAALVDIVQAHVPQAGAASASVGMGRMCYRLGKWADLALNDNFEQATLNFKRIY